MKKVLAILLACAASVCLSALTFPTEEIWMPKSVKVKGFYYYLYPENGTATLTGKKRRSYPNRNKYLRLEKADIPSVVTYKGQHYTVTTIGYEAFDECYRLQSVTIPSTVTRIGANAFHFCNNLQEVFLHDSVSEIDRAAFALCLNLRSVRLPNGLKRIEDCTFIGCDSLKSIILPDSLTYIGDLAFKGCENLQSVTFPDSLRKIDKQAFEDCYSLTEIRLPDSLEFIGKQAFSGCSALRSITLPRALKWMEPDCFPASRNLKAIYVDEEYPWLRSIDGILYAKDTSQLVRCPSGKDIDTTFVVPESVMAIWKYAFFGCQMPGIVLPPDLTRINEYAFCCCHRLTSITIPEGVTDIYYGAFQNCSRLKTVILPGTLKHISDGALYGCGDLDTIVCKATTPPSCYRHSFALFYVADKDGNIPHIRVYVPEQSIELYKAEEGWNSEVFVYYPLSEYQPKP